jgi:hypothetical protein
MAWSTAIISKISLAKPSLRIVFVHDFYLNFAATPKVPLSQLKYSGDIQSLKDQPKGFF